jgi:Domain of unknown function (DUF4476)
MAWLLKYFQQIDCSLKRINMKKLIIFILASLFSVNTFALYDNTRLVVSTTANQSYTLLIDGYTVGEKYKNGTSYYVNDINSANHRIQLYKQSNSIFGGNTQKLIYDNTIFFKMNTETTLSLNMFGNVVINEQAIGNGSNNNGGWNGNGEWNGSNNNGNWNNNGNNNNNGNGCGGRKHKKHKHHNDDDDDDDDNSWNNNGGWNNNNNGNWNNGNGGWTTKVAMNDKAFYQLKQSIQNESFDDTKQAIAAQAIRNNYFTSTQIKELVQLFSFESSKLAVAKLGYKNTIDKQNYFIVNDAFSFSSSKQELMQYTQNIG